MDVKENKMATQKAEAELSQVKMCDKCGSIMVARMIAIRNGGKDHAPKFVRAFQCTVCRHWRARKPL